MKKTISPTNNTNGIAIRIIAIKFVHSGFASESGENVNPNDNPIAKRLHQYEAALITIEHKTSHKYNFLDGFNIETFLF